MHVCRPDQRGQSVSATSRPLCVAPSDLYSCRTEEGQSSYAVLRAKIRREVALSWDADEEVGPAQSGQVLHGARGVPRGAHALLALRQRSHRRPRKATTITTPCAACDASASPTAAAA